MVIVARLDIAEHTLLECDDKVGDERRAVVAGRKDRFDVSKGKIGKGT